MNRTDRTMWYGWYGVAVLLVIVVGVCVGLLAGAGAQTDSPAYQAALEALRPPRAINWKRMTPTPETTPTAVSMITKSLMTTTTNSSKRR